MTDESLPTPEDFEDRDFALSNKAMFDEFIMLVVKGAAVNVAFKMVFPRDICASAEVHLYLWAIQRNPYYKHHMPLQLKAVKADDLWSPRQAIHQLLCIVKDSTARESARIKAIQELNIIYGITVVDEAGNTKLGRSMDDFYKGMDESALYPESKPTQH